MLCEDHSVWTPWGPRWKQLSAICSPSSHSCTKLLYIHHIFLSTCIWWLQNKLFLFLFLFLKRLWGNLLIEQSGKGLLKSTNRKCASRKKRVPTSCSPFFNTACIWKLYINNLCYCVHVYHTLSKHYIFTMHPDYQITKKTWRENINKTIIINKMSLKQLSAFDLRTSTRKSASTNHTSFCPRPGMT